MVSVSIKKATDNGGEMGLVTTELEVNIGSVINVVEQLQCSH